MSIPYEPEEVVDLLRSADVATLYFYSQHMADVVSSLIEQLAFFEDFFASLDSVSFENLNEPLTKVSMNAILDAQTLNGLLNAMQNDRTNE